MKAVLAVLATAVALCVLGLTASPAQACWHHCRVGNLPVCRIGTNIRCHDARVVVKRCVVIFIRRCDYIGDGVHYIYGWRYHVVAACPCERCGYYMKFNATKARKRVIFY
jgi:hypothetical protein